MPRAAPPAVERLPCSRWPAVDSYWAAPWTDAEQRSVAEKYRAMSGALANVGGTSHARLRTIAQRWPGALREAQITAPAVYEGRAAAVARSPSPSSRASWSNDGLGAITLWADLHGLLGDVARMRSATGDPFAALEPARRACWPAVPTAWPPWVLRRFDAGLAIAWLAALAGLDARELDETLRR